METIKRWASTQNIIIIAAILLSALIGISYYQQTKPIRTIQNQIDSSKKVVNQLENEAKVFQKNVTKSEKQRIEDAKWIDTLPDDDLQNAIDSAYFDSK